MEKIDNNTKKYFVEKQRGMGKGKGRRGKKEKRKNIKYFLFLKDVDLTLK